MGNIKLVLEYDGTDFHGWQFQPDHRTVQGEVEKSLSSLCAEPVKTFCAGRTDSGVHALGQVVNFRSQRTWPLETWIHGGNALLPRDVRILQAEQAAEAFHSRYSARTRSYRYCICQRPLAIGRQYHWHVPVGLDLVAMQRAISLILGEHDFESFCQAGSGLDHHRCRVDEAEWHRQGEDLVFEITANRFVHNMVRILVGTCVQVGRGSRDHQEMAALLLARDRRLAGPTAPPQGLFLAKVNY